MALDYRGQIGGGGQQQCSLAFAGMWRLGLLTRSDSLWSEPNEMAVGVRVRAHNQLEHR
jgi:hypothetical protein